MSIDKYKDMIYMDRPVSQKHKPMPLENRAAQFAPFAALTGYDDAVTETARLTESKIELSEEKKAELDQILSNLNLVISEHPKATITYFVPDEVKTGGAYVTISADIRKIDSVSRTVILMDRSTIAIDDIISIEPADDQP